jgi:hypothetical protein
MERDATEAEKLSKKWSEKGFIQEEIGQLRKLLNSLDEERDKLRVEPAQGIRVQILGNPSQPAEVPTKPD